MGMTKLTEDSVYRYSPFFSFSFRDVQKMLKDVKRRSVHTLTRSGMFIRVLICFGFWKFYRPYI